MKKRAFSNMQFCSYRLPSADTTCALTFPWCTIHIHCSRFLVFQNKTKQHCGCKDSTCQQHGHLKTALGKSRTGWSSWQGYAGGAPTSCSPCPLHNPITSLPPSSAVSEQPHSAARSLSGTAARSQGTELYNILSGDITYVIFFFFFSRSNIIKELDVIFHANRREMSVQLGKFKNSHYIWLSDKTEEQFFLVHRAVIPSTYWRQGAFAIESVGRGFPLCIQQTINIS